MSFESICPVCKFECHPMQLKSFGMCVICVVGKSYGFTNARVPEPPVAALPAPKPIVIDDVLEAYRAMQSETVTLAQLGLTA